MVDRKRSAERPDEAQPDPGPTPSQREGPRFSFDRFSFEIADPRSTDAVEAMTRYFAELDVRFDGGFDPGDVTADAEAYAPPRGLFVLVRATASTAADPVAACGALQRLDEETAEVKRMWVNPDHRGHGLGRRLLAHLEHQAADLGHTRVVLDTNATLGEAIALYQRSGYRAIERYNDNPYAQRWFAKSLPTSQQPNCG